MVTAAANALLNEEDDEFNHRVKISRKKIQILLLENIKSWLLCRRNSLI